MSGKTEWEYLEEQAPAPEDPFGSIQWKGTTVCMDVVCLCGAHLHVDAEFLYYLQCGGCKAVMAVSPYVKLVPLPGELSERVLQGDLVETVDPEE